MPIGSAAPVPHQAGDENPIYESPPVLISDCDKRALQRLVSSSVSQDELRSLVKTIVSNVKPTDIAKYIQRSEDAQIFIDVIDQVRDAAALQRDRFVAHFTLVRF